MVINMFWGEVSDLENESHCLFIGPAVVCWAYSHSRPVLALAKVGYCKHHFSKSDIKMDEMRDTSSCLNIGFLQLMLMLLVVMIVKVG